MNTTKFSAETEPPARAHPERSGSSAMTLVACLFSLLVLPGYALAEAEWTFQKRENGIEVHTRPVAGSGIQEFRGVGKVDQSAAKIEALLTNADALHTWFPDCPESKRLQAKNGETRQYSVMSTPWPVDDRDNVLRRTSSTDRETGILTIRITADPSFYPEQSGRVRVQRAQGSWILEPLSASETRVTFQMHLEPGGGIPEWMINARIVSTPIKALTGMREKLRD